MLNWAEAGHVFGWRMYCGSSLVAWGRTNFTWAGPACRYYRQMQLHIGPEALELETPWGRQVVAWGDIAQVRIRQSPQGAPRLVTVFPVGQSPLHLWTFADLPTVACLVQSALPANVRLQTTRAWLDWEETPVTFSLLMAS